MAPGQAQKMVKAPAGERKYQVFISSTFGDMSVQRQIVINTVVERGHMPVALERFPAADRSVPNVIQKAIEASQIYVVIVGFRYGAMVPNDIRSFTELEYDNAAKKELIVLCFLMTEEEARAKRVELTQQANKLRTECERLSRDAQDRVYLAQKLEEIERELGNEKKYWDFRKKVEEDRFYTLFTTDPLRASVTVGLFSELMVFKSLLSAEEEAIEKRVKGWIREPGDRELAETVALIAQNRFLVDVVSAMAKFEALDPRVRDHSEEKQAAARFFEDKYMQGIADQRVSLFFESGSTVAYVAEVVGKYLSEDERLIQISTNNVLAYLIFWLVHRIRCSLFPWGPPESKYGAIFGPIDYLVKDRPQTNFPPRPLTPHDYVAIDELCKNYYSPAKWEGPALLLGALSGLQLKEDNRIFNCLGPHVGSYRNKVFKRFTYHTMRPIMLFLTADKIDSAVDLKHCHFILSPQDSFRDLGWDRFIREWPLAFCVGCDSADLRQAQRFENLGFEVEISGHPSPKTAFVARNRRFIEDFEKNIGIV